MRSIKYDDDEEITTLKAEKWQLDLLKMNPEYTSWGPHEDYMLVEGENWNSKVIKESWEDFRDWKLNDYNECVNFYFELARKAADCDCGDGYAPEARMVVDSYYSHRSPTGIGWKDKITQDEYEALVQAGRINYKVIDLEEKELLTREEVNEQNSPGARGMGHDGINQHILIEARLKRMGLPLVCPICNGKAYNYVEDFATVNLIIWMIHPRKGASRGIEIKNIKQNNLEEVFSYLREAAERNMNRFSKIK